MARQLRVTRGAVIQAVTSNSAAAKAGLLPTRRALSGIVAGDVIVKIDSRPVAKPGRICLLQCWYGSFIHTGVPHLILFMHAPVSCRVVTMSPEPNWSWGMFKDIIVSFCFVEIAQCQNMHADCNCIGITLAYSTRQ